MKDRTKIMFANAIMELGRTKSVSSITVTDLVDYCGVNRYTFYYHFKDKYDLLLYIMVSRAKAGFLHAPDDSFINREQFTDMMMFIKEHKHFFKSAFSDESSYSLKKSWLQFNLGIYQGMLRQALHQKQLSAELDAAVRVVCYGTMGLFFDWLDADCADPIEKFVQYTEQSWQLVFNTLENLDGQVSLKQSFHRYVETISE